jgi:hypothetical protein
VFQDTALVPVVFPGVLEELETHLVPRPGDDRIIDIDYCNNASAIHHLDPIDDLVIREWGPDGKLVEATLLLGRLAKGAFTEKAEDIPVLKEKRDWILQNSGTRSTRTAGEIRAAFNRFPRPSSSTPTPPTEGIIDEIVHDRRRREAVHCRKGSGYEALRRLLAAALPYQTVAASGMPSARSSVRSPSPPPWIVARSPLPLLLDSSGSTALPTRIR